MVTSEEYLVDLKPLKSEIKVAGGRTLMARGSGNMSVKAKDGKGKVLDIKIRDVLVVPGLGVNLLSVPRLAEKGVGLTFTLPNPYISLKSYRFPIQYVDGLFRWRIRAVTSAEKRRAKAYMTVASRVEPDESVRRTVDHASCCGFAVGAERATDLSTGDETVQIRGAGVGGALGPGAVSV